MHTKDQIEAVIQHFGGTEQKCAAAIGVSQPTVNGWRQLKHGMRPRAAMKLESVSDGVFKAIDFCPELAEFANAN